ncbi:MAG: hypothetical protein PHN54_01420 [Bacilli bacterium]|nr:hypothetical protein [Bacilli bacterium]
MTFIDFMGQVLPIILYAAGIALLIILIIIGIKFIKTMNKVEDIVEDVDKKVKSLNGVFNIIDNMTDKISSVTDRIVDSVAGFISRVFKNKKNKEKEMKENDEEKEEE